MGKIKSGADLAVGDVIMLGDNGKRDVRTTVLSTGLIAPPDLFGRRFSAVWALREDTGKEGLVCYGPGGVFVLAPEEEAGA